MLPNPLPDPARRSRRQAIHDRARTGHRRSGRYSRLMFNDPPPPGRTAAKTWVGRGPTPQSQTPRHRPARHIRYRRPFVANHTRTVSNPSGASPHCKAHIPLSAHNLNRASPNRPIAKKARSQGFSDDLFYNSLNSNPRSPPITSVKWINMPHPILNVECVNDEQRNEKHFQVEKKISLAASQKSVPRSAEIANHDRNEQNGRDPMHECFPFSFQRPKAEPKSIIRYRRTKHRRAQAFLVGASNDMG